MKKGESAVLRDEASNTFEARPHASKRRKIVMMPKRERVHVAVHRYDNSLFYKRLEPEAFAILSAWPRPERGGSLHPRDLVHGVDVGK